MALKRRQGESVRDWLHKALSWRVSPRWYLAAFGVPLTGVIAQAVGYALFFGDLDITLLPERFLMWLGIFPVILVVNGGNEEFGWRGFMLPQLQRSHGALTASLFIGIVWLGWHLPSDFLMTSLGGGLSWSVERILKRVATIPLAIILTWLYNSTEGSVLLAMIFHASWNTMGVFVPAPFPSTGATYPLLVGIRVGTMTGIALVIVALYRWRTLSRHERHTGQDGSESTASRAPTHGCHKEITDPHQQEEQQ